MTQIRWGLIGCGKQGARYLEPRNGARPCIGFNPKHLTGEWISAEDGRGTMATLSTADWDLFAWSVDAVIVATPPSTHAEYAIRSLEAGKAVLLEKPAALTWNETRAVLDAADRPGAPPLLIASPHLYARKFLELSHSPEATVVWAGPERTDGSCSAYLDWGPHAFSMAQALGTERIVTGAHPSKLCSVTSNGKEYHGQWSDQESPMLAMIETMERIMHGGFDWRSGKAFTRAVYSKLFANQPSTTCAPSLASVNKTPT